VGSRDDAAGRLTDPALRLLSRIADFIEPLTRFDRGHLALEASEHRIVEVTARQRFRVSFDFRRTEGNGDLPAGIVPVAGAQALAAECEAQLAAARASAPGRLSEWAAEHGQDTARRPAVTDCFAAAPELGHVEACATCQGAGKTNCAACLAAGAVECPTCAGRGSRPCTACQETGQERCKRCYGQGYEIVHRQEKVWDAETSTGRTRNVPHKQTCGGCGGSGDVVCAKCSGHRQVTCSRCSGERTIPCPTCSGAGKLDCTACDGTGGRHHTRRLVCTIEEAFEVSPRTTESDVANVLKSLGTIGEVLAYADEHRSNAETNATTFDRETVASIPVTSIMVAIGARRTQVHGFGAQQDVHDYGNIAGILLTDDLDALEAALPAGRTLLPKSTPALEAALAPVLASEVNVAIAENPGAKGIALVQRDFRSLLSDQYMARTSASLSKAIRLVYWSAMLRGPIGVLALPLLQVPVGILLRSQPEGARFSAMAGVMLLAFGGAILAHMLVTRTLQTRLAPGGAPKLSRIFERQGVLRNWLIGAGIAIVLATLALAGLTGMLIR
jgi:hypothetical protein